MDQLEETKKLIEDMKKASKPKMNTKTYMWLTGVLFISTGAGLADYRVGLIVAGILLLLTVMVSD